MKTHAFGRLWPVSSLTLGGGGLGMLWGPTTFDECVATVHDAVAAGINLLISRRAMATVRQKKWSARHLAAGFQKACGSPVSAIWVSRPPAKSKASCGARLKTVWDGCGYRASTCSSCIRMSCRMLPTLHADPMLQRA